MQCKYFLKNFSAGWSSDVGSLWWKTNEGRVRLRDSRLGRYKWRDFTVRKRAKEKHDRLGRAGAMRGLVIDEVAARGVVAKPFSLGSGQPRPRAGRRKHIADGPQGAASRGASKAKSTLQRFAHCSAGLRVRTRRIPSRRW